MIVPAIQTQYEGCLFRSRLEARWAVVFDTLGLRWRYEPEGFALPNGQGYLVDFYLVGIGYVEIKPTTELDNHKWDQWCESNMEIEDFIAYRFMGDIPSPSYDVMPDREVLSIDAMFGGMSGGLDHGYSFCVCPMKTCGKVGIQFEGRGERICKHDPLSDKAYTGDSAKIKVAYIAARSMRFGERT